MRRLLSACIVLALLPLPDCDDFSKEAKTGAPPVVKVEPAPTHRELTATEISTYVSDSGEWTLEPSKTFRVEGDLRPFWIVTGRITNSAGYDIGSVRVRLTAYDKSAAENTVLDTADFDVQDIPSLGTKAFRRDVQLMIHRGHFRWNYEFLTASVKTPN